MNWIIEYTESGNTELIKLNVSGDISELIKEFRHIVVNKDIDTFKLNKS
jgi:hypothetical protein